MIGKTNSIVVVGGDTPATTTDKYKGLRPSYWPTIKMPDEFEDGQTYELLMEIQWLGDSVNIPLFSRTEGYVDWGDGSGKQKTTESYTYNQSSFSDAFPSFTTLTPKTSYAVIKVYGAKFNSSLGSILPTNVSIVEVSSKDDFSLYYAAHEKDLWKDVLFYSFWQTDTQYGYQMEYSNMPKCILWPYSRFSRLKFGYSINIFSPLVEFPELVIDDKTQGDFKIYDVNGKFASVSNDKLQGIPFYWGFDRNHGNTGDSELQFFPYTTATDWGDIYSPFYGNGAVPSNLGTNSAPVPENWGMINLYVDSNLTFSKWHTFFGRTDYMKISPYIKAVENSTCDWKNLFYNYGELQVAKLDPSLLAENENSLQDAFFSCSNLRMVIMPENSLKVSIDLTAIQTWYSESYTDPETGNSYNSLSEYAWTVITKALYDFEAAGNKPSYTPTLTVSTTIYNELPNYTDDNGNDLLTAITNKGWTVAQA